MLCVLCVCFRLLKDFPISSRFKDHEIRFETNLQSFHLFFKNRTEALCEPKGCGPTSFSDAASQHIG